MICGIARAIAEGLAVLDRALAKSCWGSYQLQAAVAALHAQARRPEDTDWAQIAALYSRLASERRSPVVELNRAVAVAMADGYDIGLKLIDRLADDGRLDDYHLFHAARADLLRRCERRAEAARAYRRALELVANASEKDYLMRRLAETES